MKAFMVGLLLAAFTTASTCALAQDEATATEDQTARTVDYVITLGDGDSILVFGDGNSIYLPPAQEDGQECPVNHVKYSSGLNGWVVNMAGTSLTSDGTQTDFSQIVLLLSDDGTWTVLLANQ